MESTFITNPSSSFQRWTKGRAISTMGTNAGAEILPFQSWRHFKEAFAPELIERAVSQTSGSIKHIVDPFGGSGTTALAAQFLGIKPTTIEVNPFLADLIEAKICHLDVDNAAAEFARVVERASNEPGPKLPVFDGAPATFVEPGENDRYIFSQPIARRFLAYRSAIDEVKNDACRRLFRVVLAATAIPVSNVMISGKGRRYRKNWQARLVAPNNVDNLFKEGVLQAIYDLRRFASRPCLEYCLLRGDARNLAGTVGNHDLAIFSPPYPNSFDYTDVYNVELWSLGYLNSREANTSLRQSTLRSHVQILRDWSHSGLKSNTLAATIDSLQQIREKLWNRHIPEMIGAYVDDMATVLSQLALGLRTGGRVYMVVGDSRYAGIDVPVAQILDEISSSFGYKTKELEPCRSMRASPQQGGRQELPETLVVLERR